MTLDMIKKGQDLEILKIPDAEIRAQSIRVGVFQGSRLNCCEKYKNGPCVLKNRLQEIAIGNALAKTIEIKLI